MQVCGTMSARRSEIAGETGTSGWRGTGVVLKCSDQCWVPHGSVSASFQHVPAPLRGFTLFLPLSTESIRQCWSMMFTTLGLNRTCSVATVLPVK